MDLLLLKLSNNVLKSYNYSDNIPGYVNSSRLEAIKILPFYPVFKIFMSYCFVPLKPALRGLADNISFLDIADEYNNIKINCDWCSICNGIIETARATIINNPELLLLIDFKKLAILNKYLDFVLIERKTKLENNAIRTWCNDNFKIITPDLLLFSQIYLKLEMVELRWCPFKRSKEFYYRNKDARYIAPSMQNIYAIGKILAQHETVTCDNCPKIINANWEYTRSTTPSLFEPLLRFMMGAVRDGGAARPHNPPAGL
jgi:hypothetical protein